MLGYATRKGGSAHSQAAQEKKAEEPKTPYAQPTTLAPSQHIPHHTHTHIQTPPCNHLLTTNPNPPTIWKQPCFGQGPQRVTSRNEISPRPKSMKYQKDISSQNTTVGTHTFLTMGHGSVHSISRILQRHPSLPSLTSHIITTNLIPPTEPSYHYGRNSRPVKYFSSILIDLLRSIVVTDATFH